MKEVETKVVVKGLRQCVSDSQVLKDNLPLCLAYTRKHGGYIATDFGFVCYDAEKDCVYYSGTWWEKAQLIWDEKPYIYRWKIIKPITMKEVRKFVQACRDGSLIDFYFWLNYER